ncbi:methyl-accepting chemotaxis protein [Acidaminobacter sp. JC074]|uniref:methyl-accepting chemotaxis protein n=1 Tax=Acidaminobacter sp. JC074 TaxID=2530199 RepID=UPI001F0E89A6|nr:methyl-accepting chemotaxis protein [Acidaminobacter sp. JC074]
MSIKLKVTSMISILILVAVTVLAFSTYSKSVEVLEVTFEENTAELNNKIADGIRKELNGYIHGVEAVAINVDATDIIEKPEYEPFLRSLLKNYVTKYPSAFQMYLGTKNRDMFIEPHFDFPDSYDNTKRGWYIGAKENMTSGWTDMYTDAVTGNNSISGYAPVIKDGEFIGAVATSLDLSHMSEEIGKIKVGKTGYVFVLDSNGTVVFHPDPNEIGNILPVEEIQAEIALGKEQGVVYYEWDEREKIAEYIYLPETRWYIMTSIYTDDIEEKTTGIWMNTFVIGAIAIAVGVFFALIFASRITKPINSIVASMKLVENGDMTVKSDIRTRDETGQLAKSFNQMVSNVNVLLGNAADVTVQVADAAQNLAASAEETSASADEVSRTVDEIASGAGEQANDAENASQLTAQLDHKLTQLHENSQDISGNADNVKEVNNQGEIILNNLREATDKNSQSTERIAEAVIDLEQKTANIDNILVTISSIAEQTNLLALNASIEAARAGEHGRGFAVVAEEIRKLAEESANSADQISDIVKVIQGTTKNAVSIMDDVKVNAKEQYDSVGEMDMSFRSISQAIEGITVQIQNIDSFINEIIDDKDQIVASISNISAVSEETAASSEQVSANMEQQNAAVEAVASAADELSRLSHQLSTEIEKFKI